MPKQPHPAKKDAASPRRARRSDAGITVWMPRDRMALTWIGEQYGIRLDQLQRLLGRMPGPGAQDEECISEGAARAVVTRWTRAGWARTQHRLAHEPFWVWLTQRGLRELDLPYAYHDLAQSSLDELPHLYAINDIRLAWVDEDEGTQWVSERQLLHGVSREKGMPHLHRPDGELCWSDGELVAIEAELSAKKPFELAENLLHLVRGERYIALKQAYGAQAAREMSRDAHSPYQEIWYFAPPNVRRLLRRTREQMVQRGDLTQEEAARFLIRWYPLTTTEEEEAQETAEMEALDGVQITIEEEAE